MMSSSPFQVARGTVHVESDIVPELARWLSDRRAQGCVRISLLQRISESNHHPVEDYSLGELDDVEALAQVVYSVAFREANATRASLAYGVFAFSERPEPFGRYVFRVDASQGRGWAEPAVTPTDERTEIVKMLMGHTDLSARLALGHSRGILDQYERLIDQSNTHQGRLLEQAHARIAALEARELEALELRDKLQALVTERENEVTKNKQKQENLHYTFDRLTTLAPMLLSSIAGARGISSGASEGGVPSPNSGLEVSALLVRFVSSLTKAQAEGMEHLLSGDQLLLLAQLFQLARAHNPGAWSSASASPTDSQTAQPSAPAKAESAETAAAPARRGPETAETAVQAASPAPLNVSSPALSPEAPSNDVTPPSSTTPTPSK